MERQIRDNDRIWGIFRDLELQLIGAADLPDIIALIARTLPARFPRVGAASVALVDPKFEFTRLLPEAEGFVRLTEDDVARALPNGRRPFLGPPRPGQCELLFPNRGRAFASVAVVPLMCRDQLIGSLAQASAVPHHFGAETHTDFLEHLAAVGAICIENAMNQARLKQDGLTDPLTGIANRRFFERRLQEETERSARTRRPLACLLADIDHFKSINDRFGHQAGDFVLQNVADALAALLRASDVLARYGGEEFVLLLPDTDEDHAAAIAERLRERVAGLEFSFEGRRAAVTLSLGVACLAGPPRDDTESSLWLVQRADAALYRAKAAGRNRVEKISARDEERGMSGEG